MKFISLILLFAFSIAAITASATQDSSANNDGYTPLHKAARQGNHEVAQSLIKKGADVNAADNKGRTPLHLTAIYDKPKVAEILLMYKADISAVDSKGWTPLDWARRRNSTEIDNLLLEALFKKYSTRAVLKAHIKARFKNATSKIPFPKMANSIFHRKTSAGTVE